MIVIHDPYFDSLTIFYYNEQNLVDSIRSENGDWSGPHPCYMNFVQLRGLFASNIIYDEDMES